MKAAKEELVLSSIKRDKSVLRGGQWCAVGYRTFTQETAVGVQCKSV